VKLDEFIMKVKEVKESMADLELSQAEQHSGMKSINSFKQFKVERELGKGGFGSVYMVTIKNDTSGK